MKWFLGVEMFNSLLFLLLLSVSAHAQVWYSALDSSEALVRFSHWVEIESTQAPTAYTAQVQVERQITHLFGPLAAAEFPAVPKVDHTVVVTEIEKISNRVQRIHYTYEGHFVVSFGSKNNLALILPNDPDKIYAAGWRGSQNPCTDSHYQSAGDFWYFWNPANRGCSLQEGRDYTVINVKLERLPNQKISYPEYSRLADAQGVMAVALFFGMDSPVRKPDPLRSTDVNANNFIRTTQALKALGFISTEKQRRDIYYYEVFEKKYAGDFQIKTLQVKVYFGPTGINESVLPFHKMLKDAFEKTAVIVYDGHSGLGGHLDLDSIEMNLGEKINFPNNRYQILFFNSCSSYPYYNTQYFARKVTFSDPRGSKNLDILTNGLSTYFDTIANSNFALLNALNEYAASGKRLSYQVLAEQIDSQNLFGVNGDEDNPK